MKKIALFIIFIAIALSYSCKKEDKMVQTTISGQLRTNGTEEKIRMSVEFERPIVKLYEEEDGSDIYANGYKEVASVQVDKNARYSFDIELNERNTYFVGYRNLDTIIYFSSPYSWAFHDKSYRFNYISVGASNDINFYCLAKSWIRPRFINSNSDTNNQDVFEYRGGIGSLVSHVMGPYLYGSMDTTFSNALFKTWSGTYRNGIKQADMAHKVYGKLTRNGQTKDMEIIYNAPPFDTTVVEIRY